MFRIFRCEEDLLLLLLVCHQLLQSEVAGVEDGGHLIDQHLSGLLLLLLLFLVKGLVDQHVARLARKDGYLGIFVAC